MGTGAVTLASTCRRVKVWVAMIVLISGVIVVRMAAGNCQERRRHPFNAWS
jgi:hypothetical protein